MTTTTLPNYSKYVFYSDGRIYSNYKKTFLQPALSADGYLKVAPYDDMGKQHTIAVHRLIALAFIPNPDPEKYTQVNHKDENKLNNDISNLEWVTPQENETYQSHRQVLLNQPRQVAMYDKDTNELLQIFNTFSAAAKFLNKTTGHANISRACKRYEQGLSNVAYGYRWQYVD